MTAETCEAHVVSCVNHFCEHHYDHDPVIEITILRDENNHLRSQVADLIRRLEKARSLLDRLANHTRRKKRGLTWRMACDFLAEKPKECRTPGCDMGYGHSGPCEENAKKPTGGAERDP